MLRHCSMTPFVLFFFKRMDHQWFSKCGLQKNRISVIRDHVRKTNSQAPTQVYWFSNSGSEAPQPVLWKVLQVTLMGAKVWELHCIKSQHTRFQEEYTNTCSLQWHLKEEMWWKWGGQFLTSLLCAVWIFTMNSYYYNKKQVLPCTKLNSALYGPHAPVLIFIPRDHPKHVIIPSNVWRWLS